MRDPEAELPGPRLDVQTGLAALRQDRLNEICWNDWHYYPSQRKQISRTLNLQADSTRAPGVRLGGPGAHRLRVEIQAAVPPPRITCGARSKTPDPGLGIGELFIGELGRPGLNAHTPFETV